VGFFLRLSFARGASLYIDEPTTLLAARYTAQSGAPRTPSGAYYTSGLLFTYLEAAVLSLGPYDKVATRLPSVLLGTGTILALFLAGRRLFGVPAALLAATWLALDPEAITWDGRARMYALLLFFVVLAVYYFVRGVVGRGAVGDLGPSPEAGMETRPTTRSPGSEGRSTTATGLCSDRDRHLFVLFFLAALFTQQEAALLLPPLGLVWLLWQSPRDWLRPSVWLDLGLLGAGLGLNTYLHRLMVLPGAAASAVSRPFVAPGGDMMAGLEALSPFFLAPGRWPATALFAVGLLGLAVVLARKGHKALQGGERGAAAALSIFLIGIWLEMALVVGESWRRPRYLLLILPWFLLVAAAGADGLLRTLWARVGRRRRHLQPGTTSGGAHVVLMFLVTLLMGAFLAPRAVAATRVKDYGYDLAFESIRRQWLPGDAVATIAPSASLFFLDRCDYLAIESGFEGYTLERGGQTVEGWGLVPLLQSPSALETALASHSRLWFVVDMMRWERNFSTPFRDLVWQRMALVSSERKVLVFRSGLDVPAPAVHQRNEVDFGSVRLVSTGLEIASLRPGEPVRVVFNWQSQAPLAQDYSVFVHVDDGGGETWAQGDGGVAGGLFPMYEWEPGDLIADRRVVALPPDLPPGRYHLSVGLYEPATGERLPVVAGGDPTTNQATAAFFWVGDRPAPPPPDQALTARFGGQVCLEGYDLETASGGTAVVPGETIELALHWGACGPIMEELHTFVHLAAEDGRIAAQGDGPPMAGKYPTRFWLPGEVLVDVYHVQVPTAAGPGSYVLRVGLYLLGSGNRLPLDGGDDALPLVILEVGE